MGGDGSFVSFLVIMLVVLFIQLWDGESSSVTLGIRCNEMERRALIDLKHGLEDPNNRLSSWGQKEDCCLWEGVGCNNRTGHVERLDLGNPIQLDDYDDYLKNKFGGNISPSLLNLTHLSYLNLSNNDFSGTRIPSFLGSFKELRYLDLTEAGFSGVIPPHLGNLSMLHHLSLSWNNVEIDDAEWLSRLTCLQLIHMDSVSFAGKASHNWAQALNKIPSLVEISLSYCHKLYSAPLSLAHVNFTSLAFLDLSFNSFNSTIPEWIFNLTKLVHLDLSWNTFHGSILATLGTLTTLEFLDLSLNSFNSTIPEWIFNQTDLVHLDLSSNAFHGSIPATLGTLTTLEFLDLSVNALEGPGLSSSLPNSLGKLNNLKHLDLSVNSISGPIPTSIGRLQHLQTLRLSDNHINGSVPESIGRLSHLIELDLKMLGISGNLMNVSSDWDPPFRLEKIYMASCRLGPCFPAWLRKQENYTSLAISNTGISDTIPDWFWNLSSRASLVDLSDNNISGKMQYINSTAQSLQVDLSNNSFYGPIPEVMPNLARLHLSMNRISGNIPAALCKAENLFSLDLSNNFISGEIPNCWENSSVEFLDFSNNNLQGGIPSSICTTMPYLRELRLSNNNLTGEISSSMKNCTGLTFLDLSHNKLKGSIPTRPGESFPHLRFLLLGSNMLSGNIPPQLSSLDRLQVLDLSNNKLSGVIPPNFGDFTAMKDGYKNFSDAILSTNDNLQMIMKGRELVYPWELFIYLQSIDISNNHLSGSIPDEIGKLTGLRSLNLSGNQLGGRITEHIGEMRQLESLDLSRNKLSGEIPANLSNLYSLEKLNLSYNDLSGRIPTGHQLQTLDDPSIYAGNDGLCGSPLPKKCPGEETSTEGFGKQDVKDNDHEDDMLWLYDGLGAGFAVGIWTVGGLLVLKRTWRIAYFRFVDSLWDWLYVAVAINKAKLKRTIFQGSTKQMR